MRVVCISDTHGRFRGGDVPAGDLLIHAGDLTGRGGFQEIAREAEWLRGLAHPYKIVIAGNHDFGFEQEPNLVRPLLEGLTYLEDSQADVNGWRIWGSPWQPWFYDWAFNLKRGAEIRAKWDLIPPSTHILVTHGPPAGICDLTDGGERAGCADLLDAVRRLRPRLHVFGHIHEGYGVVEDGGTTFVNASTCDARYRPVQPPIVLDLPDSPP